jgi:uridine kinase
MYTLKLNNEIKYFKPGDKVIDLIPIDEQKQYMVCKINESIKELTYPLSEKLNNCEITLLKLDHLESGRAYEATLRYIISMAFANLYPNVDIKFNYNVSRAIFCQILNKDIKISKITNEVLNEVERIIKADLPIVRETVTVKEAIKIYQDQKHDDKLNILKYRPDQVVNLYHCENYYDYMYCYMLPSTGFISNYVIKPYSPGLIIQYPRYELNAEIPEFNEEPTYGKTLRQAGIWGKITKTDSIVGINHKIEEGNIVDFIQTCEMKHNNMLAEVGKQIKDEIDDIRLICIAGPSSSGKTTFCNRLRIELMSRGIEPIMISMDDYYLSKTEIAKIQGVSDISHLDLEHINCLDIELFNKNLFDLINGDEVTLPKYNFKTGKRESGKTLRIDEHTPIMIEGIHALNEKLTSSIPKHQKYKVYIAPQAQINIDNHSPLSTTDLRLIRRIVRDMNFRNCPPTETISMWQSVRNGEFKWIYPNQEGANYVFNSELTYELAVFRKYALPELQKIDKNDKNYVIANRLIKYLKYFKDISDETAIPCNSLIREFIGGSCFKV